MGRTFCAAWLLLAAAASTARAQTVLVEAESFDRHGGWVLDTQFIDTMGSPYLLAHGLGRPVHDAVTIVRFPRPGTYRVFVRTLDWVGRWKAPGAPGRFEVRVDGRAVGTFGTRGSDWHWDEGGTVNIERTTAEVALHDLAGFEGRCDAIAFIADSHARPPEEASTLAAWRRTALGLREQPEEAGPFDLVVVGGGYGGIASAISAARLGCRVALVQNRPVLGGNGSSEVRVWAQGGIRTGPYPELGSIVAEFMDHASAFPGLGEEFGDDRKEALVRAERNITLYLNHHAHRADTRGSRIAAVWAFDTRSGREVRLSGSFFADCTGHGSIGVLAGADHTVREKDHLGASNMWRWTEADSPQPFPETPWALDLDMGDFPYPRRGLGGWFWESGFNLHPLRDLEAVRDWNFRAVYGAFNAMKNRSGKEKHARARLEWVAYIAGTRESVQLLGDVVLTRDDIVKRRPFPDGCVPTTWDIDLHYPKEEYMKKYPDNPFISKAVFDRVVDRRHGYPVPYRCFYSRNVENLFMAGRCVSVTHEALGTVRVQRTGGMIGEVVGKAAALCVRHACLPRDVYTSHLEDLKRLLRLPGTKRLDVAHGQEKLPE